MAHMSPFRQRLQGIQTPEVVVTADPCVINPFSASLHSSLLAGLEPPLEQVLALQCIIGSRLSCTMSIQRCVCCSALLAYACPATTSYRCLAFVSALAKHNKQSCVSGVRVRGASSYACNVCKLSQAGSCLLRICLDSAATRHWRSDQSSLGLHGMNR